MTMTLQKLARGLLHRARPHNGLKLAAPSCIAAFEAVAEHSAESTPMSPQWPYRTTMSSAAARRFPLAASSLSTGVQTRSMFIQTQQTPNPASLMFVPGKTVMETGAMDFDSPREAMKSPLAVKLFSIEGVKGVFYGSDFITVTKDEDSSWAEIKPHAFAAIMDHFTSGAPLISAGELDDNAIHDDDDEVVAMIKELLETRIRPAVAEDGGDIAFKKFDPDTGVVVLKMKGACSGCPSSSVTLKSGIENMLMHYIPEVKEVKEDDTLDEAEVAGLSEFQKLETKLSA